MTRSLKEYREAAGLTQDECAIALGLRSGTYLSMIETAARAASLSLALKIEAWSAGAVPAETLVSDDDRALLRDRDRARDSRAESAGAAA